MKLIEVLKSLACGARTALMNYWSSVQLHRFTVTEEKKLTSLLKVCKCT